VVIVADARVVVAAAVAAGKSDFATNPLAERLIDIVPCLLREARHFYLCYIFTMPEALAETGVDNDGANDFSKVIAPRQESTKK